jgi:hypothetical protein
MQCRARACGRLADRHRVHRRTARQALESAVPPSRKQRVFTAPVLDPLKPLIDAMLRQDLDAPRKQRHTARRVLARLVDEHDVTKLSYSTVRDYVAKRRPQILAEAGRTLEAGCVPQTHEPAAEAEVDFHDLWVLLRGVKTKTALFTMRLSCSARWAAASRWRMCRRARRSPRQVAAEFARSTARSGPRETPACGRRDHCRRARGELRQYSTWRAM